MVESSADTNVRVAVRCRPLSTKEKGNGEQSIINIDNTASQLVITDPSASGEPHSFGFDLLFDSDSEQDGVWDAIGRPIMNKAFSGFNGTIFAYGQTGSGKTWSMQGLPTDSNLRGIIPRMNMSLFEQITESKAASPTTAFLVTVSYFELYNEIIFDLLDQTDRKKRPKGGLEIKEHPALGVYVKGLQEIVVDNSNKLQTIIDKGMSSRTVASTAMNADSSRSHSVFVIKIHQKDGVDEKKNIFAKINLVDLAGSERVKSTGAQGATLKEGANINKSLSALGNVINALVEQAKGKEGRKVFIPYRNSKLTRVLQESLGGNSVTAMLAALSPAACNFDETLSTLKYANRAKAIKVKAVKNEEASQISKLNDEIKQLKEQLQAEAARMAAEAQAGASGNNVDGGGGGSSSSGEVDLEVEARHTQQLKELEDAMRNDWEAKSRQSEEHDEERRRLALEQKQIAQRLEKERQRQWSVLTTNNDANLTLKHVKQATTASIENGNDNALLRSYANSMQGWTVTLIKLAAMEIASSEQFTVLQIFSKSLLKDCNSLSAAASGRSTSTGSPTKLAHTNQGDNSTDAVCDRGTMSLWKQLRDRLKSVGTEFSKWTPIQDNLTSALDSLHKEVLSCVQRWDTTAAAAAAAATAENTGTSDGSTSTSSHSAGGIEIGRGLHLLLEQVQLKVQNTSSSITAARQKALDISWLQEKMTVLVGSYRDVAFRLEQQNVNVQAQEGGNNSSAVTALDDLLQAFSDTESALKALSLASLSASAGGTSAGAGAGAGAGDESDPTCVAPAARLLAAGKCSVSASDNSELGPNGVGGDSDNTSSGCLNAETAWIASPANSRESYLQFKLPRAAIIKELHVQGGWGPLSTHNSADEHIASSSFGTCTSGAGNIILQHSSSEPELAILSPSEAAELRTHMKAVQLPGPGPEFTLTLSTITGDPVDTAAAIGSVMEWPKLLKKQDPQKFLKRPPVRFLFDLFKFLGSICVRNDNDDEGVGDADASKTTTKVRLFPGVICDATWEETSKDKSSKLNFMRHVIHFISTCVGRPENAVTTAASIVTGSDVELTNQLLQQTALIVHAFQDRAIRKLDYIGHKHSLVPHSWGEKHHQQQSNLMSQSAPLPASVNVAADPQMLHKNARTPVWPIRVKVSLSKNGRDWLPLPDDPTACTVQETVVNLSNWTDIDIVALDNISKVQVKATHIRVQILEWETESYNSMADSSNQTHILPSMRIGLGIQRKPTSVQVQGGGGVSTPRSKSDSNNAGSSNMSSSQALQDTLDVFQRCTKAPIKTIELVIRNTEKLRQRKQEERLQGEKNAFEQQFRDANEGERAAWAQERQELYDQLNKIEAEKSDMQNEMETQIENNLTVSQELVMLQAENSKNEAGLEQVSLSLAVLEDENSLLQKENQEIQLQVEASVIEKEEFQGELVVLTEERDAARQNEEELFEKIEDITKDLEELQQSYVDTTERCNDAVDELMDARDTIAQMQENRAAMKMPATTSEPKPETLEILRELKTQVSSLRSTELTLVKENTRAAQEVIVFKEQLLDAQRIIKSVEEEKKRLADEMEQAVQDKRIEDADKLIQGAQSVPHIIHYTGTALGLGVETTENRNQDSSSGGGDVGSEQRNNVHANGGSPAMESKLEALSPRERAGGALSPRELEEAELGIYTDLEASATTGTGTVYTGAGLGAGLPSSRQLSEGSFASYGDDFDDEEEERLSRQATQNAELNKLQASQSGGYTQSCPSEDVLGSAIAIKNSTSAESVMEDEGYGDDDFEDDFEED